MKKIYYLFICLLTTSAMNAQTLEELKEQKSTLQSQIDALQASIDEIDKNIKENFPDYGWKFGLTGTVGANLSGFNNWGPADLPNSRNTTILGTLNSFANRIEEQYFWRSSLGLNLGWQKLVRNVNNPTPEEETFAQTADIFNVNSLYGYRITEKFAASALGEYRTTLLNNFNNPGFLDLGIGATWTPMDNLIVVFHPLNYNFIFSSDELNFESSLGTKIVADYHTKLFNRINWRSNLSAFVSYKDPSEFSNYTWTNSFSFNAWQGIGIGIEYALRINKQETAAFGFEDDLQQYFVVGLTYSLAR